MNTQINELYKKLNREYKIKNWWPVTSRKDRVFEIAAGCILTQNTSWRNVEKAIANLKENNLLNPKKLLKTRDSRLKTLIRPAGYYNQKAERLKSVAEFLLAKRRLHTLPMKQLRDKLLKVKGIGPETADSILLYALDMPSFVIDAYTRRVFSRVGIVEEGLPYDKLKMIFESNIKRDTELYQKYHAAIVEHAKDVCRKNSPSCEECILSKRCAYHISRKNI